MSISISMANVRFFVCTLLFLLDDTLQRPHFTPKESSIPHFVDVSCNFKITSV